MQRRLFWQSIGLQIAQLLGGSILIEMVFSWPGTGYLLNTAIATRDMPLLQGTILVLAIFFVLMNFLVDLIQPLADPQIVPGLSDVGSIHRCGAGKDRTD